MSSPMATHSVSLSSRTGAHARLLLELHSTKGRNYKLTNGKIIIAQASAVTTSLEGTTRTHYLQTGTKESFSGGTTC